MRLFAAALLLCAMMQSWSAEPANIVPNPGFEELTADQFPAQWRGGEFGKPGKNVTLDDTVAHSGSNSVKLGISPGSFVTCASTNITVKPETKYFVSWWCKTEGMRQARAYMFFQTSQAQRVFEDMNQFGSEDWTLHLAEYTTTSEETWLHPVLTTHDQSGPECYAWFDDIGVYEGSFPDELAKLWATRARAQSGISETAIVLSQTPELTVWSDNLAARIYREDGLPDYAKPAEGVAMAAARNEEEFFQVSIIPAGDLANVTVSPEGFSGAGEISADCVRWWPVGYANIKTANKQSTRLGMTPDPLLDPAPVSAPANQNTTFLVGVRVPAEANAGEYSGSIALRSGEQELSRIPVSLKVHDFSLPQDPTFRTLITFSPTVFNKWDKRPFTEVEKDICTVLAEHGIRGHGATITVDARIENDKVVCDFGSFDARIGWVLDNLDFNAFFLGPMFGGGTSEGWESHKKWLGMDPLSDEFNRYFPEYMRQVGQHLREKGWLEKAYLYLWDEPEADYFDNVVALQKLALQGDPDFKIWETTSPSFEKFWGTVNAWSVPFSRPYFEESAVDGRRAAGDEIWVYNIPATLEAPPQIHRLWFWQAARYDAVGAQLWNVTFYHGIDPWDNITPEAYPVGRDRKGLYHYDAGQAIMLYPNPAGEGKPIPCLRLKLLQKGIDDFEYLTILQERLEKAARERGDENPAGEAQAQARAISSELVRDINKFEADTLALNATRAKVAEQIEQIGEQ